MKHFSLALLVLISVSACNTSSPTGASDVQFTDTQYFRIFPQEGMSLSADVVAYADQTWEETARCEGADPTMIGLYNLWIYPKTVLTEECGYDPKKDPPVNGCFEGNRIKITANYQDYDQGWRHEFVHLYLDRSHQSQDHAANDSPEINQLPWKCQFYWLAK